MKANTPTEDLNEPVLPDDYPIFADYWYVADGKPVRSDWHGISARQFKNHIKATELRRCDIAGRAAAWHEKKAAQRADTIDECIVEALKYDSVIDVVNSLQAMK